ncbi:glycosyltransferase family 1 protein [Candidatus Gracilibacteria bacterium]|nr:glycosyltransferase family 1 protein [Candidatus Gracilibacteria bacterium]
MRIAMLSVHSSPLARLGGKEAGGMNVYVRELARELGQRGVPVDIFTRSQDRREPTIVPLSCGARVINLHTGPAAPYDKNMVLTYLPEFVSRVRCFADGQDLSYDIIHSHYFLSGEAALRLRRSWGVPVVHMFHTLAAMKNSVARSKEETETGQRIAIERRLLQEVDAVVAATPLDKAQMVWHYEADADGINVIPCGVDLRRFHPQSKATARAKLGIEAHSKVLLTVGRMEPLKGMDCLIHALAELRTRRPEWANTLRVLLVGGENEQRPERWNAEQRRLAALRAELGLGAQVVFLGAQSQELLPSYYAAADAVVVPSHYESFGLVALEAMACGTPVLASNVGGLATTIEDGRSGMLFPVNEHGALAERLERLFDDETLAGSLSHGGRQRAESYGWDSIARQMVRLYSDVIEDSQLAVYSARRELVS